jgi:hypothetical protein
MRAVCNPQVGWIGLKDARGHWPDDHSWRCQPIAAQTRNEGLCQPTTKRHHGIQALPLGTATAQPVILVKVPVSSRSEAPGSETPAGAARDVCAAGACCASAARLAHVGASLFDGPQRFSRL